MKQLSQDARSGAITVTDVPVPHMGPNSVLVRVVASVVSAGTERAVTEFAEKSLAGKAKARPDLVRQVVEKIRRDGLLPTIHSVRGRLDQPLALGYSCAGTVIATGEQVTGIQPGDRVACAGANYAIHAEVVSVPRLLVAKVPVATSENASGNAVPVPFEAAAFTTLGAVALHGVRTAEVKLGDVVAVIGLGLLGQLTVQILRANGCVVVGIDPREERAKLARRMGADAACTSSADLAQLCREFSRGIGADAVLITAETPSSDPVELAAQVARDRGAVVSVGAVGLNLRRDSYFKKELSFRVSRSYGPGRYDADFEEKGRDYPAGFVRWTETRNMDAFLDLLASGKVDVTSLISHRFPLEQATDAYELITGKSGGSFLGVLLTYSSADFAPSTRMELPVRTAVAGAKVSVGLVGAGGFALTTLLPAMQKISGVDYAGVCSASGAKAKHAAEKFGFRFCTTSLEDLLADPSVNTAVIATRHSLHAGQVIAALKAGKNVFCEKPLCLSEDELRDIVTNLLANPAPLRLMVGFNRRYAPMSVKLREFMRRDVHRAPMYAHYRVNAGFLPPNHWTQDASEGGRMLGEVCHFLDYLTFVCGAPVEVEARTLGDNGSFCDDNVVISVGFANGSRGVVSYMANGDRAFGKERIEVFGAGKTAVIDDFRTLELSEGGKLRTEHARLGQDKGHRGEWEAFVRSFAEGKLEPVPLDHIIGSTLLTLHALTALRTGERVKIDVPAFKDRIRLGQ